MTGYGRAERRAARLTAAVEVRSVNARHLQPRFRLPPDWLRLEARLEAILRATLRRGSVDVHVRIDPTAKARRPRIDQDALSTYRKALAALGETGVGAELLRLPGVVSLSEPELTERTVAPVVLGALQDALAQLDGARLSEGERLRKVLARELTGLAKLLRAVRKRLPGLLKQQHEAVRRRLSDLLEGRSLASDDPFLLREVAVLADRSDVREELDRLDSHLSALRSQLETDGPVGRELDFLLQEVGREVNTLGSKVSDVEVTGQVVAMKTGVERLREQVANLE